MNDDVKPTTETRAPNLSTEHQRAGDARRPSDTLDRGQPEGGHPQDGQQEGAVPRKSSLTKNA